MGRGAVRCSLSDACRKSTSIVPTLPDRANNLPACLNGVRGQIGTTIPFDKIAAIDNLHKFAVVSKVLKRLAESNINCNTCQ